MEMEPYRVEVVPVSRIMLGEGPHWDAKTQELLYVDVYGKSVHRYNPVTGKERKIVIDDGEERAAVSFVVPVESEPDKYLIGYADAVQGGLLRVLEWTGTEAVQKVNASQLKILHELPAHDPPISFNDGKCDAKGRLWTGSLCVRVDASGFEMVKGVGHVYRLDTDGQLSAHVDGIDLANGLAWSPDNSQFYYIDSNTFRVDGFDYDLVAGSISNRRTVFDLKAHSIEGSPDGMCADAEGNLWIAVCDGGKVIRINPHTGELLRTVEFPCKKISSCAFGGPNLDTLYVTSGQFGLSNEEAAATDAGAIYKVTGGGLKGARPGMAFAGKV